MPTDTPATIQPKLTAEQALLRLLELIRTSKTIADFTPERLSEVMKVPITAWDEGYGFGEAATAQWNHGFTVEMWPSPVGRGPKVPMFEFMFNPRPRGMSPSMIDICQVDFDRFTAELEAMGFRRSHNYDSPPSPPIGEPALPHGRLINDAFYRPDVRVEVYPRGEANDPVEKITHDCVERVVIY